MCLEAPRINFTSLSLALLNIIVLLLLLLLQKRFAEVPSEPSFKLGRDRDRERDTPPQRHKVRESEPKIGVGGAAGAQLVAFVAVHSARSFAVTRRRVA